MYAVMRNRTSRYLYYSIVLNPIEFIFEIKLHWDNRHQLHTSNKISIQLKTKELLTNHYGCHGNKVARAKRYVTNVYGALY